jgi:hypothetical protein
MNLIPAQRDPERAGVGRRKGDDWRKTAPRWFLVMSLTLMAALCGILFGRTRAFESKEEQRIEAALTDAPTKYQARLSERVAVVEAQTASLDRNITSLTVEVKELTTQVRLLTAELKKER